MTQENNEYFAQVQRDVQNALAEALEDERKAPELRKAAILISESSRAVIDELELPDEPMVRSMMAGFLASMLSLSPDS